MSNNNVKEYPFIVTFYPDEEKDGKDYYVAFAPDLPGCITCGVDGTISDDLISNCKDVLKCWVEAFGVGNDSLFVPSDIKLDKIPEPSDIGDIRRKISIENSFVIPITLEMTV